ncbi:YicC/YloC family endoribonuclease [Fulvivirga lutea]|uniref:YicC family protein n=1 Tax=Fulvivirga lutea TaxID=2810512 RepID=A0A974WG98_9BACT|nr:YicC/YloC family endoribonuclease [Fulvivirga lutea]QSE97933.1 YicC family protein [Fulvivirga lutea]
MLKSMTGYGAASGTFESYSINVEVKTLNSKFLDVNLRLPRSISEKELEVRNIINDYLERGKVSMSVDIQNESETVLKQQYNAPLFQKYYSELEELANLVNAPKDDLFRTALSSPDVIVNNTSEDLDSEEYENVKKLIKQALEHCNEFRAKEGDVLQAKLLEYINSISTSLKHVEELDPKRVENIKTRIKGNLTKFIEEESLDKNRLEQEIIYYIEKLDITEEKVRLKNHLNHFEEVIAGNQNSGKKLGFISQEIGREINTIGSKANDSDIQKHVVSMKEELEKIKEQLLNVL